MRPALTSLRRFPAMNSKPGAVTASTRPRLRATWSAAPTRPVAGGRGGLPHVVFSRIAQCRPEVEHAGGRVTGGESEPGVRRRGAVKRVRGEHPDILLDVPDVLLDVVDVLRDAGYDLTNDTPIGGHDSAIANPLPGTYRTDTPSRCVQPVRRRDHTGPLPDVRGFARAQPGAPQPPDPGLGVDAVCRCRRRTA